MSKSAVKPDEHLICVLGMHRSGTSALAGALNLVGVNFGSNLMPAQASENPKGYWEHLDIVRTHDDVFTLFGASWDDPRPLPESWWSGDLVEPHRRRLCDILLGDLYSQSVRGVKDPRMCRLLPLWHDVARRVGWRDHYCLVHRNPVEVAMSLKARNGFCAEKSLLLWVQHNLLAERYTRGRPRLIFSFESFLDDPAALLERLADAFEITWDTSVKKVAGRLSGFVSKSLHHQIHDGQFSESNLPWQSELVKAVYEAMNQASDSDTDMSRTFDSLLDDFNSCLCRDTVLTSHLHDLQSRSTEEIARLESLLKERTLWAWRLDGELQDGQEQADLYRKTITELQEEILDLKKYLAGAPAPKSGAPDPFETGQAGPDRPYRSRMRDVLLPQLSRRRAIVQTASRAFTSPKSFLRALSLRRVGRFFHLLFSTGGGRTLDEKLTPILQSGAFAGGGRRQYLFSQVDMVDVDEAQPLVFPEVDAPRVSIIIPVWNKYHYTYYCLQSIVGNTYRVPYEVIVVDNGSEDETSRLLEHVENIHVIRNSENAGFIAACNQGAKAARGEYLLFLNNDTQVMPGWLDPMVRTLDDMPAAGLVGAKLIYPDGRLQEAGSIIWNDETDIAWNFGRFDDPAKPEYNYVKTVDYCSAACVLVRNDLFKEVGMFSQEYSPAFFEDTDLAFKIRQKGREVLYQPAAEVIHFEGVTAGTDTDNGIKKHQVTNQQKFFHKWRAQIESSHGPNGQDVFRARDRSQDRPIMLYVDHYVPMHDKDAGSFITREYLAIFIQMGFKIVFWPDNLRKPEPYTSQLQQVGIEVIYGARSFDEYIHNTGRFFDWACICRPHIAPRYIDHIQKHSSAKIVYVAHDLHFLRLERQAAVEKSRKTLQQSERLKHVEFDLMRKSAQTAVFSPVEQDIIAKEAPDANPVVWPWIQPVCQSIPPWADRKDLLYVGGFGHEPNVDAACWFVEEVLPKIKRRLPDIRLILAGSNPSNRVKELASKDVEVTGYVPDLTSWLSNSRVFVCPLRYGAGFKGKIMLAMAHGLPVVTTQIGAEGMTIDQDGVAVVTDDPKAFADHVVRLYADRAAWGELSKKSIEYVRGHHSPEHARQEVSKLFSEIAR